MAHHSGGRIVSKFEFSLHTALKLRGREENLARQCLADARRAGQALAEQLREACERHDRVQEMLRGEGEVPLAVFANGRTWLSAARAEIAHLRERLARAEELCEQRRAELLVASRRKKTLERLSERREAEHLRAEQRGEQRQLDEMAALVSVANAAGASPAASLVSSRPGS